MNAVTEVTHETSINTLRHAPISTSALVLDGNSLDKMMQLADLMATGRATVPKHFNGNPADCLAMIMQAMQWGMNPFAVALKTHLVNGVLGYEAQLVNAVITSCAPVKDRLHYEWFGDWTKVVGKFVIKNGDKGEYRQPGWKLADEEGLGVRVWATFRGEDEPRVLELLLAQARTRNSTLWADDPRQQLAYLATKRWSRLYCPDVILGVYSPDELDNEPPKERDVGRGTSAGPAQPEAPEFYLEEDFEKNFPAWEKAILSGKKTAADVVTTVERKAKLTEDQRNIILSISIPEAEYEVVPE